MNSRLLKKLRMIFWKHSQKSEMGRGGDAGEFFIAARKIVGDVKSKIAANGGDGSMGGKGGKITIISEDNQFAGQISAKGGKSLSMPKRWWENSWVQGITLIAAILSIIAFLFIF